MASLNVWLVTSGEPLPDRRAVRPLRTGMLASALASRGHDVLWWTSAFEHQRKQTVGADGEELPLEPRIRARTVRGLGYRRNVSIRRYVDHRLVAWRFARQARTQPRPDIIVASMPCHHLAFQAARCAVERRVPLIYDVRDLWPDIFVDRAPGRLGRVLARGLLTNDFARLSYGLRSADALVAVSPGYLRWALARAGRDGRAADRVFLLGHRPLAGGDAPLPDAVAEWLAAHEHGKLFSFFGTFGESYELGLVLQVASRLDAAGREDIGFVIAGEGAQRPAVEQAAQFRRNVLFCGWLEGPQLSAVLHRTHAGLVPCRSVRDTMPNKPYEYFAAGLPVLSSLEGSMAELIERRVMGVSYTPGDADALERAVLRVADDGAMHARFSAGARAFFAEEGDADRIYAAYAGFVESVADSVPSREAPRGVRAGGRGVRG